MLVQPFRRQLELVDRVAGVVQFLFQLAPCAPPPMINGTTRVSDFVPLAPAGVNCSFVPEGAPPAGQDRGPRPPRITPGDTARSPAVPQAPVDTANFVAQARQRLPNPRIIVGPAQESVQPWRWALTFYETHFNTSDSPAVRLLLDNVTAWAAESLDAAMSLVVAAHTAAAAAPPYVCVDAAVPIAECVPRGVDFRADRSQGGSGDEGGGSAPEKPYLAAVIAVAVLSVLGATPSRWQSTLRPPLDGSLHCDPLSMAVYTATLLRLPLRVHGSLHCDLAAPRRFLLSSKQESSE